MLAREEYGRVGVAGRIGKVPEGLYSNWERLAFHGQGNECQGLQRKVGRMEWWRKDERGSHRCGGGVGVEKM